MSKIKDLTGQRFGRLVVRGRGKPIIYNNKKRTTWICDCDCGKEITVIASSLTAGGTKSCGCLFAEYTKNRRKENRYDLSGEYGIGYTCNGDKFPFDKDDYERISKIYWCKNKQGYFTGTIPGYSGKKRILLHRYIMNAPSNTIVDHIGGSETLFDNRKNNLRIVTKRQNQLNHKLYGHNKSGCTGVYFITQCQKWAAVVTVEGKIVRLGQYKTKEEAIKARKEGEKKYYKDYSYDESQRIYKGGK